MLLAVLGVGLCVLFLALIQPIWGLVDVATSEDHSNGAKAAVIILTLILLGPLMTIGYAIFGTHSKALRRMTLFIVTLLLISALSVIGLAMTSPDSRAALDKLASQSGLDTEAFLQRVEMAAGSQPANEESTDLAMNTATDAELSVEEHSTAPSDGASTKLERAVDAESALGALPSFTAIHLVQTGESQWSSSIAQFTTSPSTENRIPLEQPGAYPICQLAVDRSAPALYAITTHEVGRILPATGRFVELTPDPAIGKPSWPAAIAFDSDRGLLLIAARSTGYAYNPRTGEWKTLPGLKDNYLAGLEYVAKDGVLYGLRSEPGGEYATQLLTLSSDGALIKATPLSRTIPVGQYPHTLAQLCEAGDELMVVVSPSGASSSVPSVQPVLYSIDPASGLCLRIETHMAAAPQPSNGG